MELPAGAQGTSGDAGLEDGGVVAVGMRGRSEVGAGAWRWRCCNGGGGWEGCSPAERRGEETTETAAVSGG